MGRLTFNPVIFVIDPDAPNFVAELHRTGGPPDWRQFEPVDLNAKMNEGRQD